MASLADVFVRLRADNSVLRGEIVSRTEEAARASGQRAGQAYGNSMAGAIKTVFAAVAIGKLFKDMFQEAQEAAKVTALTNAVIKSTGGVAQVSAVQVGNLATRLSNLAGVDDELVQSSENVLLTFTKVRNVAGQGNDIFNQATEAALNLSAALGTDLQAATILVGKALNDPIGGLTALKKAGVQLTDQEKEQIKTFIELGDTMSAQKVILAELTSQFGGAAEAAATPADKALVAWKNLEEDLGNRLLPTLNKILNFGLRNEEWLVPLVESIGAAVVATKALSVATDALGVDLAFTAGSLGRVVGALGLVVVGANELDKVWQKSDTLTKWNDELLKIPVSLGILSEETAKTGNNFDRVFGDGGLIDNIIFDGPDAQKSLTGLAKSTHDLGIESRDAAGEGQKLIDTWRELNGEMLSADEAMLTAKKTIADLSDTFKEGGKSIQGTSIAALENRVALEKAAEAAIDAAEKYKANGHSTEEARALLAGFRNEAEKATGATGKNAQAVHQLAGELFKLPDQVAVNVGVHISGTSQLTHVLQQLDRLGMSEGGILNFAKGGIHHYAAGGIEPHLAQIVRAGTIRIFGEPETGGEAYIPLSPNKRARSSQILNEVAKRFGYALVGGGRDLGIAGSPPTDALVGLMATLIDEVRATTAAVAAVAPGLGDALNGSLGLTRQLGRAR